MVPSATWRPAISPASRSNSVSEKCGVPSATIETGPSPAGDSAARASSSILAVTATVSAGSAPPVADSISGASGVTPTAWKSAIPPEAAPAAAMAFKLSAGVSPGRPVITGTRAPAIRPIRKPSK